MGGRTHVTSRRDLLIGALCLCGAGGAYALEPRRHVSLLGTRRLGALIPTRVAGYVSREESDLIAPQEDSLAARLYGQTVGRVYSAEGKLDIMMLIAHGDTQNDDLQLHRPEICYPFFGYSISRSHKVDLPISGGVTLPCRSLLASAPDRSETILYWSRLGQYFPTDRRQQQTDRLVTALKGEIADGLLARFSTSGGDPQAGEAAMASFVPRLLEAMAPGARGVFVGTARASALAAAQV